MNFLRNLFFNRIGGQIALLIVASLAVIHVFLTVSFMVSRPERMQGGDGPAELAATVRLIAATPQPERAALLARTATTFPHLRLALEPSPPAATEPSEKPDRRIGFLMRALGVPFRIAALSSDTIVIALPDGTALTAAMPPERAPPMFGGPVTLTILFVIVSVTFLGLWAAWMLRGPLAGFAQAAETFSLDDTGTAIPERGPEEIRAVARAFNRMRARIRALVDDRTRLFAAMSHDLRTPITRLRLRSEFIGDAELRTQMLRDLDQMRAMTDGVLAFLRDGQSREAECAVDIASSLQTIADQFADTGHDVRYEGPDHLTRVVRPNELHRAVVNLTDNAVRYGTLTCIRLAAADGALTIEVEDDGPGIPEAQKAAMFEPFARGDDARGMDDRSGFGLGLAIARAVVEAHGGTLALCDRQPHGLIARIALPAQVPSRSSVH